MGTEAKTWGEVFVEARRLLKEGRLTAVGVTPESAMNAFIATHLAEIKVPSGNLEDALGLMQLTIEHLYPEKTPLQLQHYRSNYVWRDEMVQGWVLCVGYPD